MANPIDQPQAAVGDAVGQVAGVLRRGTGDASWLLDEPPLGAPGADLASALDEDREDRF